MASTGNKPINVNHDFASGAKLKNLTAASIAGEAVEYNQLQTALAAKSDNLTGGSGIDVDGSTVSVDLVTAGTDYSTLTLSGLSHSSLNGVYTRTTYKARLSAAGLQLDLTAEDADGIYYGYYKDNGAGVWAVCMVRDGDNVNGNNSEGWYVALTTTDPTSVSFSGNGSLTVGSFIPNYQAVDYDVATFSSEVADTLYFAPASADSNVDYAAGSDPSGLLFSGGKLGLDLANTTADASTTKLFPSAVIKTYVDEEIVDAKDASNNVFSNGVAGITGNPTNVQSALEGVAGEINTLDSSVATIQTINGTQDSYLADHLAILGVAQGADSLDAFTGQAAAFVGASGDVQASLQTVGESIGTVYQNIGVINGLAAFETDFGSGFTNLPNSASAKTIFLDIDAEIGNLASGLGVFWSPVEAHEDVNVDISNPGTDTFGGATVTVGQRVLLLGQTDASENGIYVFATSGTALVRAIDANTDAEFSPNKTVQVLNSSEEGISGATFAYTGSDDPVVGTADLTFELKSKGVVGDNTITEGKLAAALALKLTNKTDKYAETVTFVAGTPQNITHGLASQDVIVQCRDTSGNVTEMEVDITDSGYVTVNSPFVSGDFRVVVIG